MLQARCSWVLALPPQEHWQVNSFCLLLAVPPGFGVVGSDSGILERNLSRFIAPCLITLLGCKVTIQN